MNFNCTFPKCNAGATQFCLCHGQDILLCGLHTQEHENKYHGHHNFNPIEHRPVLISLGIDGFMTRKLQVEKSVQFIGILEKAEKTQYDAARERVQQVSQQYLELLNNKHNAFQTLVQEFEREAYNPMKSLEYQLSRFSTYAYERGSVGIAQDAVLVDQEPIRLFEQGLRELQQRVNAMNELDYVIHCIDPHPPASLPAIILEEVPQAPYVFRPKRFTDIYIPLCRGRVLHKWGISNGQRSTVRLSEEVRVTPASVHLLLQNGDLFCCGGTDPDGQQAVVIDGNSGQVSRLSNMQETRANPGIAANTDTTVYVFGGRSRDGTVLRTCEKYVFETYSWERLRNQMLTGRYQFTTTVYKSLIYIVGGASSTVERFSTIDEQFRVAMTTETPPGNPLAFVHGNKLIILQDETALTLNLDTMKYNNEGIRGSVQGCSSVNPIVAGEKAFFVMEDMRSCQLFEFHVKRKTVSRVGEMQV